MFLVHSIHSGGVNQFSCYCLTIGFGVLLLSSSWDQLFELIVGRLLQNAVSKVLQTYFCSPLH